eukprot:gene13767-biopygen18579
MACDVTIMYMGILKRFVLFHATDLAFSETILITEGRLQPPTEMEGSHTRHRLRTRTPFHWLCYRAARVPSACAAVSPRTLRIPAPPPPKASRIRGEALTRG